MYFFPSRKSPASRDQGNHGEENWSSRAGKTPLSFGTATALGEAQAEWEPPSAGGEAKLPNPKL